MTRRSYNNVSAPLALTVAVDDNPATVTLSTGNNSAYPSVPFTIAAERGTVNEEVMLVTAKPTTTSFTVERGYDDTDIKEHALGSAIELSVASIDYDEANAHVNDPDGLEGGVGHTNLINRDEFTAEGTILAGVGDGTVAAVSPTANGQVLISDNTATGGARYGSSDDVISFAREGTLVVTAGKGRHRWPYAVEVMGSAASVNTAPTGASVIVDVNKNGSTIYTTQANRPSIASGANASSETVPDTPARIYATGDYLTVDIDQIGSTLAGADLTVVIRYKKV